MEFHSQNNLKTIYQGIAKSFLELVKKNPKAVSVLPVGPDGLSLYNAIKDELEHFPHLDFTQIKLVQPFEFVPLGLDDPRLIGPQFIKLWSQLPGVVYTQFKCFHNDQWNDFLNDLSHEDPRMLFPRGMDMSLRNILRPAEEDALQDDCIQILDKIAMDMEEDLREWGGVDFCAQALGYGARLFMNISGSSHYSASRLTPMNYEAMAEHSTWVDGIDEARKTSALTLGLGSLLLKKETEIHLVGLNEEISREIKLLKDGAKDVTLPASIANRVENSHLWYTPDSGMDLAEGANGSFMELSQKSRQEFIEKCFKSGQELFSKRHILHTAPHHDDIELGYFPLYIQDSDTTRHTISYLTSGFRSVADDFFAERYEMMKIEFVTNAPNPSLSEVLKKNLQAKWLGYKQQALRWEARYLLRRLKKQMKESGVSEASVQGIVADFLNIASPMTDETRQGHVNFLKSCIREWEGELVWAHLGFSPNQVKHLKLDLYGGSNDDVKREITRIAVPLMTQMEELHPDVITVVQDPEASAPRTHYRCLLAVREAVRLYKEKYPESDLKVLTYRNVWTRFPLSESNMIVPASLNDLAAQEKMFENCFVSQFVAQYPSPGHDGSFAELASKVWMEQFGQLSNHLNPEVLTQHKDPRFRKMAAAIFMKEYSATDFLKIF